MKHTLEIRSFELKPGTRETFHTIFVTESLVLLRRYQIDVVAFGASTHDDNGYYVMRAFTSLADRQQKEDAFYHSDDWRKGPRESVLACIEKYLDVVLEVDDATLAGLRR